MIGFLKRLKIVIKPKAVKDCTLEEILLNCGTVAGCCNASLLDYALGELKDIIRKKSGREPNMRIDFGGSVILGYIFNGEESFDHRCFGRVTIPEYQSDDMTISWEGIWDV